MENNEKGILKAVDNFGARGKRNVAGAIYLRVGDLLVSGSGKFLRYITQQMKREFGTETFEGVKAIYVRMQINNVQNEDFGGMQLRPNGYGDILTILRFRMEEENT